MKVNPQGQTFVNQAVGGKGKQFSRKRKRWSPFSPDSTFNPVFVLTRETAFRHLDPLTFSIPPPSPQRSLAFQMDKKSS